MTQGEAVEKANEKLHSMAPYVHFMWYGDEPTVELDGGFEVEDLEKIIAALREIKNATV